MLAIYAHPNDPEVSCAGTLVKWARAGAQVHLVIVARGDKGSADPAADPGVLAAERAREVETSAGVLGLASVEQLGRSDGEVANDADLRRSVVALIRKYRPEIVVCPDPTAVFFGDAYVNHADHRAVGWAALDAVAPAAGSPLYFPDTGAAHQIEQLYLSATLEPDTWVDISATLEAKVEALACHATQLAEKGEWLREFVRDRAEQTGRDAGLPYAEAFRRLTFRR